jgi:2-succinyl-5-enolpyruvyl-6-hydroxy-3-cyclohexene-1-carboxylate synthase
LVCTSGSALLNYYPAVTEAFYSDIPLVVLSADRPEHLVGIGDGQTIVQTGVYGHHVLYEANLKLDKNGEHIPSKSIQEGDLNIDATNFNGSFNLKEINKAIGIALHNKGPVHINCPFDEPLYETEEKEESPVVFSTNHREISFDEDLAYYKNIWKSSSRKMILVGVHYPGEVEQKYLDILANDESVIVFTETTSNLHHENFFSSIDQIIAPLDEDGFKKLRPEILLTFGGLIVSKKIKAFLRAYQPKFHWHVDTKKANDTFFCLNKHFKCSVNFFFKHVLQSSSKESEYCKLWSRVRSHRLKLHDRYLNQMPYSDFLVFDTVLKSIPEHSIVQSANSSTIRYLQLFELNKTLQVFCNRGTSGIDGSTSTAIGAAVAAKRPTVLITGDLSFFYDSNALWNGYIPESFRIIMINNGGGGIFRILPGHKNTENFDTFFETTHKLTAKQLCEMYQFEYCKASNIEELNTCLDHFYKVSDNPKLLEVFTPRKLNDEVLLNYFKFIK